jgi:hypothetical protein
MAEKESLIAQAKRAFLEAPTQDNARAYLRVLAEYGDAFDEQEGFHEIGGKFGITKEALLRTLGALRKGMQAEREAKREAERRATGSIFKDRDDIQMQVNSYIITEFSVPDKDWEYVFDVTYTVEDGREMQKVDDNFMIKQANLRKQNIWLDLICRATKSVVGFEDFATTLEGWLKLAPHTKRTEAPRTIETQMTGSILDMFGKMQKTTDWETYKSQPLSYVYFERETDSYYLANEIIHDLQQIHKTALPSQAIRRKLERYMHEGEAKEMRKPEQDKKLLAWRFRASAVDGYGSLPVEKEEPSNKSAEGQTT